MTWQENGDMRLDAVSVDGEHWALVTQVRGERDWKPAATAGFRAVDQLVPTETGSDFLAGELPGVRWRTHISPEAGGFWLDTVMQVDQHIELDPAMILWIGTLDNLNDRQAHTWRQTILRAPTVNQQGLPGNDLAAGYLYDHATHTESICYFPGDAWYSPGNAGDNSIKECQDVLGIKSGQNNLNR